jgi:hypothetical protein
LWWCCQDGDELLVLLQPTLQEMLAILGGKALKVVIVSISLLQVFFVVEVLAT